MNRSMVIGILLTLSFFGVLAAMLSPIWDSKDFLSFADNAFNQLSKGSVYFIPELSKKADEMRGKQIDVKIKMADEATAGKVASLYSDVANVEVKGKEVSISGDFGVILSKALQDADLGYRNQLEDKATLYYWWISLREISKYLKQVGEFDKALTVDEVMTRGIEPAYNYFGIEAKSVGEEPVFVTALLVFYVIYTVWWGYAIYFLFEGAGLRVTKAKEKKEV